MEPSPDSGHLRFREADTSDLARIVELLHDDEFGSTRNPLLEGPTQILYESAFIEICGDPNNGYVVAELFAESGVRVVGCYQLTFIRGLSYVGGLRAQIESVRIDSSLRGSGLGSEMMHDAIERARSRQCTLVQLTTDLRREHTRRFYERLGFATSHHGMKLWLQLQK
jgi:ribosomal protein S18 acetylase RimI-like enzyme